MEATLIPINPDPEPPPKATKPTWRGLDVLFICVASVVLLIVSAIPPLVVLGLVAPAANPRSQSPINLLGISIVGLAAEALALSAAVILFGKLRRKYSWRQLGFTHVSLSWWAYAIFLTFAAAVVGGIAAVLVQLALGLPQSNEQLKAIAPAGFSWLAAIAMTLLGGVAVPVAEELLFRAVIHRWASEKWGFWVGALLSSFLFGLAHISPPIIAFAFVMGLVIAYTYEQTKSLVPGLIIHIVNNSIKIIFIYALLAFGVPVG